MTLRKVCILGNSVALRTRPIEPYPENRNYTYFLNELLNDKSVLVENHAVGAHTVKNLYQNVDQFIHIFPEVFIINIGVVDACTREVPLWFYRLATRKSEDLFSLFVRFLYRRVLAKVRSILVYLRFKRPWISKRHFKRYLYKLTATLLKETNCKIIFIPINVTNDRVENKLPGSRKNHLIYNGIIKEISEQQQQFFLSIEDLKSEEHYPDGVHYSTLGHKVIADRLADIIQNKITF